MRLSTQRSFNTFRLFVWLAPVMLIAGCSRAQAAKETPAVSENFVSNPQIELPLTDQGLPTDWSIEVHSGTYKSAPSKTAHSGKYSLAFAGSGGEAEVRTNPLPIRKGSLLQGDVWVQASLLDKGIPSARVAFRDAAGRDEVKTLSLPANSETQDWQRFEFLCEAPDSANDMIAFLAIGLRGEGLLRIDDAALRKIPNVDNHFRLADGGFERPNENGVFPDWKRHADGKDCSGLETTESPHSGKSSVRIEGARGWCCLASETPIPGTAKFVCFRGYVRAQKGEGHLQIDYVRNGVTFGNTRSGEIKADEWTFVSVTFDRELAARANQIVTTIAAADPGGEFSADFDDLEVFVCQ